MNLLPMRLMNFAYLLMSSHLTVQVTDLLDTMDRNADGELSRREALGWFKPGAHTVHALSH